MEAESYISRGVRSTQVILYGKFVTFYGTLGCRIWEIGNRLWDVRYVDMGGRLQVMINPVN